MRSITDLMVLPGLINLDFADVRSVMTEMGKAMMGTGEGTGEGRALMAAQNAIQNPLLDEVSLKGAKAVLVNVTGGLDMTLLEVDEAANAISSEVDPDGNIIFGAAFDPSLEGRIRVSVVATGMDGGAFAAAAPTMQTTAMARSAAPVHQPVAAATRTAPVQAEPVAVSPTPPPLILQPAQSAAAQPFAESITTQAPLFVEPTAASLDHQPAGQSLRIVDPLADDDALTFAPPAPRIQTTPNYLSAPAVEHRRAAPTNPLPDPRLPPEKKSGWMEPVRIAPRAGRAPRPAAAGADLPRSAAACGRGRCASRRHAAERARSRRGSRHSLIPASPRQLGERR